MINVAEGEALRESSSPAAGVSLYSAFGWLTAQRDFLLIHLKWAFTEQSVSSLKEISVGFLL